MSLEVKKIIQTAPAPKKLMIFLHGYNGDVSDIESSALFLSQNSSDLVIVLPESNELSEKNDAKKQWYSMWEFDPEDKRRDQKTTLENLLDVYDKYGDSLALAAREINTLIDHLQSKFQIENKNTSIAGFSQGAMLACFTALSRKDFDGKCLMFSGVVAGANHLEKDQKSTPDTYLFHGKADTTVNYKTLNSSLNWLKNHAVNATPFCYEGLTHRLSHDVLTDAAKILKKK